MCSTFYIGFVLILIFEILDLANDDPHLHTVPQQIGGVRQNCWFVIVASILFLEFSKLIL
jgi:hypothetical protein